MLIPIIIGVAVVALFVLIFSMSGKITVGGDERLGIKKIKGKHNVQLIALSPLDINLLLGKPSFWTRLLGGTPLFRLPKSDDAEFDNRKRLAPDGCVVSLQNGLNELVIAEVVGAQRTVGAFVNFSADYLEPGLIHFGGPGTFVIGELDGSLTPRLAELQRALAHWGTVRTTDNIWGSCSGFPCIMVEFTPFATMPANSSARSCCPFSMSAAYSPTADMTIAPRIAATPQPSPFERLPR